MEYLGDHARADRRREGRHLQAGRAGGRRRDAPGRFAICWSAHARGGRGASQSSSPAGLAGARRSRRRRRHARSRSSAHGRRATTDDPAGGRPSRRTTRRVALAMLRGRGRAVDAPSRRRRSSDCRDVRLAGRFHRCGPLAVRRGAQRRWRGDRRGQSACDLALPHPVVGGRDRAARQGLAGHPAARCATVADRIVLTIGADGARESRAWSLDEVAAWATIGALPAERIDDFDAALRRAGDDGCDGAGDRARFTPSGDAMERLQVDPLAR